MPEITYENIKPLISAEEVKGAMLVCTFKCPSSDFSVQSAGAPKPEAGLFGKLKSKFVSSGKKQMLNSARKALSRTLSSVLGRMGRDLADEATGGISAKANAASFSDKQKQEAAVEAFEKVAAQFVWDEKNGRWISAKAGGDLVSDFVRQLQAGPVSEKYDREVLARMLAEVAAADGKVGDDEKNFLGEFIPPDMGGVDEVVKKEPLSKVELEETSQGKVRETMLMLAWAVALTDEELAEAEKSRLAEHQAGLGIGDEQAAAVEKIAKSYVLEQALEAAVAGGVDEGETKKNLLELGAKVGVDGEEVERMIIRRRKQGM